MEELEAIKEAEETALKQAELAAEEAAKGLFDLDEVSLHTNDEDHIETPSTRSLSRDDKSSPENSKTANSSAGSFQNPTQPLSARIKPNSGLRGHEAGMTDSAIQRHVRLIIITYNFVILYTNTRANVYGFHHFTTLWSHLFLLSLVFTPLKALWPFKGKNQLL